MAGEDKNKDYFEGYVAHPELGEKGWRFCFVHGTDLSKVARWIQYFIDLGYEFVGAPFVFNGEVCQAMRLITNPEMMALRP
jgi:hypothetical protein